MDSEEVTHPSLVIEDGDDERSIFHPVLRMDKVRVERRAVRWRNGRVEGRWGSHGECEEPRLVTRVLYRERFIQTGL